MEPTPLPGSVYCHYKKGDQYKVLALGRREGTDEEMVVYQSLEGLHRGQVWIRPLHEFTETVDWENKKVLRFSPVLGSSA